MTVNTTRHAFVCPATTDALDITQIKTMADGIDQQTPWVTTSTPSPQVNGLIWHNSTTGVMQISDGTSWLPFTTQQWVSYTPTWTSTGTAPALGNGTLAGRYIYVGYKTIHFEISQVLGSTSTLGTGYYNWNLPPFAAISTREQIVLGRIGTGGLYPAVGVIVAGATTLRPYGCFVDGTANGAGLSATSPAGQTTGTIYTFSGIYETV